MVRCTTDHTSAVVAGAGGSPSGDLVRLAPFPDHVELESEILDWWEREDIFGRLRQQIAQGPPFRFLDGPVTANKTLGVHTAWGRTLKDVFQRYKALCGFNLRFQNGFDCQGLWIEVGVEQELGLNSKREVEAYGLEAFASKCRDKVAWSVGELTRGSKRLGYWMDWGNDYLTFSDTNIEYIWKFLRTVHERGWLYLGHRATEWCPRCGTSVSQHELSLSGVYKNRSDPSLYVRFPLLDRAGSSLVAWTTTPWTLTANVAAAVHPHYRYGRRPSGDWVAVDRFPEEDFEEILTGEDMVGWRYRAPFEDLDPAPGIERAVIPWDEVTLDQGTGIVHIAPGCGAEDFELSTRHGLAVISPVDESGRFYSSFGFVAGDNIDAATRPIIDRLADSGLLVEAGEFEHPYPHCWRCGTALITRVADDWYIDVGDLRGQLREANRGISWTPEYLGKRMDDWLANMGDWNISRRRFYGLPLPFYPCTCGELTVISSKSELAARASSGMDELRELHRPWIDRVTIRCGRCGNEELTRVPEVGDVWLDAGIVPFSTLGWQNPERVPGGFATGAAAGLTGADLPDHTYWTEWFPADLETEMREQVRLWFYSQLFISVALVGQAPFRAVLGYERMLAGDGREMHGSWGNLVSAEEAFERMGADVMRWMYCSHPPDRNLLFGEAGATDARRRLLVLWNSARFLIDHINIEGFVPSYADLGGLPDEFEVQSFDRWLLARANQAIAEASTALDRWRVDELTAAVSAYLDDLSNWYIRRNRRRFYTYDEAAFRTLWVGVVTALRLIGPVAPFVAEYLWRDLVGARCPEGTASIHLAGWPTTLGPLPGALLDEMVAARRVVEAGRRARHEAKLKLRQPLRKAVIRGASLAIPHAEAIRDELRVKELAFDEEMGVEVSVKLVFSVAGPRLGAEVQQVAAALRAGDFVERDDGTVIAAGVQLAANEVIRSERIVDSGWVVAHDESISVAIDPNLDEELVREGRAAEAVRTVNEERKRQGLQLTDRITVRLPPAFADVVEHHRDWLASETLATSVTVDSAIAVPVISKVPAP